MKKVSSTISHLGVIALALLALVIATVVWLFERMRLDNFGCPQSATLDAISLLEDESLESAPSLAGDSEGNAPVF